MYPEEWLRRFTLIVEQPEDEINLAEAALVVAADAYPDLDIARYLARLDEMAEQARTRSNIELAPREKISALNEYLFGEFGLRGNRDAYFDPRNSYLNDVLDRRLGIPITLSIVYIEIGKRLGFPLSGIAMPGHFIVKWKTDDLAVLIDVFDEGHIIGQFPLPQPADVQTRLHWIQSASPRQILVRLLSNLRAIFLQDENFARALLIAEKNVILQPNAPDVLREAALLAYRLKSYRRAAEFLETYLRRFPSGRGADQMRRYLNEVQTILLRLN
jgi:regulator of sirC expression with transglutaminase-like and TPR domain